MEKQKNAAILIYPDFSNYEISIVSAIFKRLEKEIVVFRAEKGLVDSEEGFHFIPDKTFDEFNIDEFDCDEGWFSGIRKPVKPEDYTFFRNVH